MLETIRDEGGFSALADNGWDGFVSGTGSRAAVFMSGGWISGWIRYFLGGRKGKELFVPVEFGPDGGIVSAAPLYRERFFGFFRRVRFIGDDYSDYLDILSSAGSAGTRAIIGRLADSVSAGFFGRDGAAVIYLKQVSAELKDELASYFKGAAAEGAGGKGKPAIKVKARLSGGCYFINLRRYGDIGGYMAAFSSKQRYNVLKRVKDAAKEGIEYETVPRGALAAAARGYGGGAGTGAADYAGEFFRLHRKRWNEKGGMGVFKTPRIEGFFREAIAALDERGILNLSFLKHEGKYIAGALCFDFGGRRQVYLPGFDPDYSRFHPGIVLTYRGIEDAFSKGLSEFDFLKGPEEYKKRFLAEKRENYKIYIYKSRAAYALFKTDMFLRNEVAAKINEKLFNFRA